MTSMKTSLMQSDDDEVDVLDASSLIPETAGSPAVASPCSDDDAEMVTIDVRDPRPKKPDAIVVMEALSGEKGDERHGSRFLRTLHAEVTHATPVVHSYGNVEAKLAAKRRTQNALLAVATSLGDDPSTYAINALPLPIQVAFRVKVLGIFTLQLLLLSLLTIILTYSPLCAPSLQSFADQGSGGAVAGSVIVSLLALFLLYLVKYMFPLNFVMLAIFTSLQAIAVTTLGLFFRTRASVFACVFCFFVVLCMTFLSTRTRIKREVDGPRIVLLSTPVAAMIAYALVGIVACLIYAGQGEAFLSGTTFIITMFFSLGVVMWFAFDASCMYQIMTPDEYMQGVIFFYTDLILLFIFLLVMGVCVAACDGGAPIACFGNCGAIMTEVPDDSGDSLEPPCPAQADST
ncbi:hypothetical protein SPRG_10889 [Saprolegnia parasitica CBS 223.65]|uniref:Uncharacterized protein n=1 Tax=Saprolegnia parasitica (strain CBS 223.65) TaxID=695850 RepID=A0A067CBB4_SAPPC|nr:hypothetical protein SPRG_10889 [Saprolegnia parasitica CBS 223.65]KDO24102.1 hypothetical protein SPRG_10889 [Saprolegnia parasitica CBS 223.65]|eukprot:XP_012205238.1 hypothetical protein SPRG_10889 [Saprolegnia parasitica CBS 223.65]